MSCPGQMRQAVASLPLRRTALKRVKVTTRGQVQQVPAQSQNRGPGNSTGDGF
ncbi:single-stranded DNA-binding protein [Klebsiella pneumoniae]|nr:single-stranded DNA-binding protein [Klebsiella pneumoniae]